MFILFKTAATLDSVLESLELAVKLVDPDRAIKNVPKVRIFKYLYTTAKILFITFHKIYLDLNLILKHLLMSNREHKHAAIMLKRTCYCFVHKFCMALSG